MEILKRLKAPTPKFWKKVRNTMIAVGTVAGIVLAAPVALPAAVATIAGYALTVGAVGTTLAQLTKEDAPEGENVQP